MENKIRSICLWQFLVALACQLLLLMGSPVMAANGKVALPNTVVQSLLNVHRQAGNTLSQRLQKHLNDADELLTRADQEDRLQRRGQSNRLQIRQEQLDAKRAEIGDLQQEIQAELGRTRTRLVKLGLSTQVEAFDRYSAKIQARFERLDHSLADAARLKLDGPRRNAFSHLRAELKSLSKQPQNQSPAPLPVPTTQMDSEVKPTPAEPSQQVPQYLSALTPKPHGPAYAWWLDFLINPAQAEVPNLPVEASACGYSAGDLSATPDVVISQEIHDLAAQLDYSPLKIFQHVYNNVRFEPYFGSLKGSTGTLYSGAGGATDQASLLIALLRAANIPARYVLGDVQILDATSLGTNGRAPRWLGAKTYQAAAAILSSNLNPNVSTVSNRGIQLRHVWVEACLPYGNYRGAAADNSGYRWIPLDPSFKDKSYQNGITGVLQNVVFDYGATGYLGARSNSLPHEYYATQVESYIKGLDPDNTLLEVPYSGEIEARKYDILPITLPYEVVQYTNWSGTSSPETASLPTSHRYRFTLKVRNSTGGVLVPDQVIDLPGLVHQRLTLSYVPADAASETIWNGWDGDLASIPASLVNLKPVLKIDGTPLATGTGSIALGTQHRLIMKITLGDTTLTQPGCPNDDPNNATPDSDLHCFNKTVYTNLRAGAHHALMAYAGQGADRFLTERANRLIQSVQSAPSAPTPANADHYDDTEGEFLHIALMKYLRYVTEAGHRLGELQGVSGESGVHLGLTGAGLKVDYLFDLPFAVHPSGPYIDVLGNKARLVKLDTTATNSATLRAETWPTFKLFGYSASAYEHFIWQELIRTDAVSTVRGLQFANESGSAYSLVTLSSANIGNWSALMDASMNPYQSSITGYVSDGATVTVPKKILAYTDGQAQPKTWNGAVYMAENQTKGYIASIIHGGLGGGYPLINTIPIEVSYPSDNYTPDAKTGVFPINSTTLANGWNAFVNWGGDPVNLATGNLFHSERDIAVAGRGLPLVFERSYNSRDAQDGPLGFGWNHSFNHVLKFYGAENGFVKVGWVDGSGSERFFHLAGSSVPAGSAFQAAPGIYSVLKRETDGTWSVTEKNGLRYGFANNAGTTAGQSARLLTVKDRNTNTLTLAYNSGCGDFLCTVTDGPGRKLAFTYTAGRISQIQVKAAGGSVLATHQYGYDGNGNLISYKSPLAVANQHAPVGYDYYNAADGVNLDHALRTTTLPQGEGMRFSYYLDGRVFRHQRHRNGELLPEIMTFHYHDFRRETVTVNERGHERRHQFDANGNPIGITDETGAEYKYAYDPSQPFNRISETDPAGLTKQYQYDPQGNVVRVTQPSGAVTEFYDFTSFNAPQRIKDAVGNWTLLKYDAKGNRTDTVQLKTGKTPTAGVLPATADIAVWRKQAYDAATGQPTQSKQLRNFTGAVLGTFAGGSGPVVTTTYDAAKLYPIQISRLGDKNGDGLINGSDPADIATLTYDGLGRLTQGIDADWHSLQYEYDGDGLVIRGTDPLGQQRDFYYDGDGRMTANELEIAANGQSRLWDSAYRSYDDAGRLQETLDAGGHVHHYQYDAAGNLVKIIDPDNYSLGFDYDPVNRWTKAYDKADHTITRQFDAAGRIKTVTDPNGNTSFYRYWDASGDGRLKQIVQPKVGSFSEGSIRQFDYDALGRTVKITDIPAAGSGASTRTTLLTYDALGRVVRRAGPQVTDTDPDAATYGQIVRPLTRYLHNPLGQLVEIQAGLTDANGGANIDPDTGFSAADTVATQVSYLHDDFGRVLTETDALGEDTLYSYDVHGNVETAQTPNGHTIDYTWGYGHRLETAEAEDGRKIHYEHNPLGLPTRAETWSASPGSSLDAAYDYDYDDAHRPLTVTDRRGQKTLTYSWSPGGLLDHMADGDGRTTAYQYDPVGRLIGLTAPNAATYVFDYDAGGRPKEVRYPNGILARLSWNADDSLAKIAHQNGATVLVQSQYGYDGLSRRSTLQETVSGLNTVTYSYQYDALDRLLQADNGTASQRQAFGYDRFGNRVRKLTGNPVTSTRAYRYDAAQQLTEVRQNSSGGTLLEAYLYDPAGNQTQKCSGTGVARPNDQSCSGSSQTAYAFDSFGRLHQISGAANAQFRYDDQGRRIQKTEGGATTHYLYDSQNLYGEYPSTSWATPTALYVQAGLDRPLARLTGSVGTPAATAAYYHQDGLGSVLALTNAAKTVTATQRFDVFGSKIGGAASIPQYGYTGREPDASGLIYYRARYYDPNQGRFTQRDPLGYTDGLNPYLYVHNNPVNYSDPNGLLARQVGTWWDAQDASYHLNTRIAGGFQAIGGGSEAFLGGAACTSGLGCAVGIPVLAHGADQFQTGIQKLWTGQDVDTFTSQGLQAAGVDRNWANGIDAGIGIVGSLGAGSLANSVRVGALADDVAKGAGKKIPNCELCGPPNKRGNAPIGNDGHPVELHHRNQNPNGPLDEMTRTDHRLGDNFKKNHSNTGQEASKIDRSAWRKEQKDYWKNEWDSGRFDDM